MNLVFRLPLAALLLGLVGTPTAHAFSGVQTNVPVASLAGWTLCHSDTYNSFTPIPAILSACNGANLLMACRQTGSETLQVAAHAPRADVIFDTGMSNVPHDANGVGWYFNDSFSWGFAPAGDTIFRNSCDTAASPVGPAADHPEQRICWHSNSQFLSTGWRCGADVFLEGSNYERLIFHANVLTCGNGTLDDGEQCDDSNLVNGDCCSSSCEYESNGATCELDDNVCTVDQCNGAGSCIAVMAAPTLTPCELDDNICTADSCDGAGACAFFANYPDTNPCIADGTACTLDHCDGSGTCVVGDNVECQAAAPPCEGGASCNPTTGACDPFPDAPFGTACANDSNVCTVEMCNGVGSCEYAGDLDCQAASPPCEGGEVCDPMNGCVALADAPDGTACSDGADCTNEECNGAGSCVVESYLPAGAPCDDDDNVCSIQACNGGSFCQTLSTPLGCVDNYLCYKAKATTDFTATTVDLDDAFAQGDTTIKKSKALCLPADHAGQGTIDAGTHQESYQIKPIVKPEKQLGVPVLDQFGMWTVDALKPDRLMVPTNIMIADDPNSPTAGAANHFQCYKAKTSKGTPKFEALATTVVDQFEDRTYELKKPKHLCVPVAMDGSPTPRSTGNLMCYQVKSATKHLRVEGQIHTSNSLGAGQLDTVKEEELCVPAVQGVVSPAFHDLTTCVPTTHDTWQFTVTAGQAIQIRADTVSFGTAADLCVSGACGSQTFSADDNIGCTFPPPSFSCPNAQFTANADSLCSVRVTTCSSACANNATADYKLTVTGNGFPRPIFLSEDNHP